MPRRLLAVVLVLLTWAAAPEAAARPWARPVAGAVAGAFAYAREVPFAAGARRGVDLVAASGAAVRSACAGRVTHAGGVPRWGRGVTVRCGALVATHLGLSALAVRTGARVRRGARLGAARGPRLRLGARRAADRWGWIDPGPLLSSGPAPLVPAVRPGGRAPRAPAPGRPGPRRPGGPRVSPRRVLARAPSGAPGVPRRTAGRRGTAPPLLAWAALAAGALALPAGGAAARRRRRPPLCPAPPGQRLRPRPR